MALLSTLQKPKAALLSPKPAADAPENVGDGEFTPEQTATLKKFSTACMKLLYDKNGAADDIVKALGNSEDIGQSMAKFAYEITATLDEKSQGLMDTELMPAVAADVLGQIVEIAQAADLPVKGKEIAVATRTMLMRFLSENGEDAAEADKMFPQPDQVGSQIDAGEKP